MESDISFNISIKQNGNVISYRNSKNNDDSDSNSNSDSNIYKDGNSDGDSANDSYNIKKTYTQDKPAILVNHGILFSKVDLIYIEPSN